MQNIVDNFIGDALCISTGNQVNALYICGAFFKTEIIWLRVTKK
jgi:hypothetical protein